MDKQTKQKKFKRLFWKHLLKNKAKEIGTFLAWTLGTTIIPYLIGNQIGKILLFDDINPPIVIAFAQWLLGILVMILIAGIAGLIVLIKNWIKGNIVLAKKQAKAEMKSSNHKSISHHTS
jgi:hypothetical protein